MTIFKLDRNDYTYRISCNGIEIHTFMENEEIKAVNYAKAFISSWNSTLELNFKSDYLVNYGN